MQLSKFISTEAPLSLAGMHKREGCGAKDVRRIYDEDTTVNSSRYEYT